MIFFWELCLTLCQTVDNNWEKKPTREPEQIYIHLVFVKRNRVQKKNHPRYTNIKQLLRAPRSSTTREVAAIVALSQLPFLTGLLSQKATACTIPKRDVVIDVAHGRAA